MSEAFVLELRIENSIISWLRNSIILIALSISLKSLGREDKSIYLVSNLAILLSLCILIYLYQKISKTEKHFKNTYKIKNFYILITGLIIICGLVFGNYLFSFFGLFES